MSKRTRQADDSLKYELLGLGLMTISAFALVSLYWDGGSIGRFVARVIKFFAGKGSVILPLALALYGWQMIRLREKPQLNSGTYGLIGGTLLALTGFHLTLDPKIFFEAGLESLGGGFIGGTIAFICYKFFGQAGTYLFMAAGSISVLVLAANFSLSHGASSMGKGLVSVVKKLRQDLSNFFFTVVEEEVGMEEDAKPNSKSQSQKSFPSFSGPLIIDHDALAPNPETTSGKGIIELAKDVVDRTFPKIQVYPEAWMEQQMAVKVSIPEEDEDDTLVPIAEDQAAATHVQAEARSGKSNLVELKEQLPSHSGATSVSGGYVLPSPKLLSNPLRIKNTRMNKDITDNVRTLEDTLDSFGVKAKVTQVSRGPAITRYELQPAPGVKVSKIVNLADDIALSLAAPGVRIEAPIPGKAAIGIEVPNKDIAMVYLRELLESGEFTKASSALSVALGKDIAGTPIIADLAKMPHLLIAGSTGSGKSVCMNTLIASVLFKSTPEQVKLLMIDPKMVELTTYNGIPHLISPVVTDPKKAATALRWVVSEMENRYNLFASTGVKNISGYNALKKRDGQGELPLILVLIDELADLMMVAPADIEDAICRLAQMARAAGIHLVVATQRPSVDVITGLIKANIPSRIAFAVSSQIDSRTILDMAGAEKLLGKGDMLFFPVGAAKPLRVQGVFVSEQEIEDVVSFVKNQGKPEYAEGVLKAEPAKPEAAPADEDELLPQAVRIVLETGQASISMLQRRLRVGYTRAARLMDIMSEKGYVGGYEGSKPRAVLITVEKYEAIFGPMD